MECDRARRLLQPHLDGELAPEPVAALEAHLALCPSCRHEARELRIVRTAVREQADRFSAPTVLRSRILADLAVAGAQPEPRPARIRPWGWFGLGAALAASLVLAVDLTLVPPPADRLADQVVSAHIRSLMEGHLTDVASTDRHTVKPWFNGRLDLAPPVQDFAAAGFPLVGGRLDVLDQRPVAALVYRHRLHVINLFVGPAKDGASDLKEAGPVRGYTLLQWSAGGLSYWLVSDLERTDLIGFARLLLTPPPPNPPNQ